jgi:predicted nucleic acid-binding protein
MIIFDTDTVTLFSHGNARIRERVDRLEEDEQLAVTLITAMEIRRGRYASLLTAADAGQLKVAVQRFREAEELLRSFLVLPVDDPATEHFERLRQQKKLKKIGRPDLLIACVALAQNALLVTRNTKDFKQVPGLRIENWAD